MGRRKAQATTGVNSPSRAFASRLVPLAAGVTLTLVAWGFLVWVAIRLGAHALNGESPAWLFLALATAGATACLFLALILIGRVVMVLRAGTPPSAPARPAGGRRRAAR